MENVETVSSIYKILQYGKKTSIISKIILKIHFCNFKNNLKIIKLLLYLEIDYIFNTALLHYCILLEPLRVNIRQMWRVDTNSGFYFQFVLYL